MNKTIKLVNCSPNNKSRKFCLKKDNLLEMKKKWNNKHPDTMIYSNNPTYIRKKLIQYSTYCYDELCLSKLYLSKKEISNLFSPECNWKKDYNNWLDGLDILRVMKQYELKHREFKFLGPVPINFNNDTFPELHKFNLRHYLKKNINKIGIVFNTDPHYRSGKHWICLFIDLTNKFILFFDSNGIDMPKEIVVFVKKVLSQSIKLNLNFELYINKIQHQITNGECGMFCLYVIIQLIDNCNINNIINQKIETYDIEKNRNIYFNC